MADIRETGRAVDQPVSREERERCVNMRDDLIWNLNECLYNVDLSREILATPENVLVPQVVLDGDIEDFCRSNDLDPSFVLVASEDRKIDKVGKIFLRRSLLDRRLDVDLREVVRDGIVNPGFLIEELDRFAEISIISDESVFAKFPRGEDEVVEDLPIEPLRAKDGKVINATVIALMVGKPGENVGVDVLGMPPNWKEKIVKDGRLKTDEELGISKTQFEQEVYERRNDVNDEIQVAREAEESMFRLYGLKRGPGGVLIEDNGEDTTQTPVSKAETQPANQPISEAKTEGRTSETQRIRELRDEFTAGVERLMGKEIPKDQYFLPEKRWYMEDITELLNEVGLEDLPDMVVIGDLLNTQLSLGVWKNPVRLERIFVGVSDVARRASRNPNLHLFNKGYGPLVKVDIDEGVEFVPDFIAHVGPIYDDSKKTMFFENNVLVFHVDEQGKTSVMSVRVTKPGIERIFRDDGRLKTDEELGIKDPEKDQKTEKAIPQHLKEELDDYVNSVQDIMGYKDHDIALAQTEEVKDTEQTDLIPAMTPGLAALTEARLKKLGTMFSREKLNFMDLALFKINIEREDLDDNTREFLKRLGLETIHLLVHRPKEVAGKQNAVHVSREPGDESLLQFDLSGVIAGIQSLKLPVPKIVNKEPQMVFYDGYKDPLLPANFFGQIPVGIRFDRDGKAVGEHVLLFAVDASEKKVGYFGYSKVLKPKEGAVRLSSIYYEPGVKRQETVVKQVPEINTQVVEKPPVEKQPYLSREKQNTLKRQEAIIASERFNELIRGKRGGNFLYNVYENREGIGNRSKIKSDGNGGEERQDVIPSLSPRTVKEEETLGPGVGIHANKYEGDTGWGRQSYEASKANRQRKEKPKRDKKTKRQGKVIQGAHAHPDKKREDKSWKAKR